MQKFMLQYCLYSTKSEINQMPLKMRLNKGNSRKYYIVIKKTLTQFHMLIWKGLQDVLKDKQDTLENSIYILSFGFLKISWKDT